MVVTFCGHSRTILCKEELQLLKNTLIEIIDKNNDCIFYLGGYGNFDNICLSILTELKKIYPNISTVFITPYINNNYSKLKWAKTSYDEIIYPEIENTPLRYAITKRNQWMIDNSNLLICCIDHTFGGAYKTLKYAKLRKLKYINISKEKTE